MLIYGNGEEHLFVMSLLIVKLFSKKLVLINKIYFVRNVNFAQTFEYLAIGQQHNFTEPINVCYL